MNIENIDFHNLPLEIQMALDDNLLGWTHLTSVTLGHVLLPLLVFHTVKRASKYVLERTVTLWNAQFSSPDSSETSIEAVLISSKTHFIMGLVAAIAAFRIIRHRRRVWFRHAYGSKEYKRCQEGKLRREAVLRADNDPNSLLSLSSKNTNSKRGLRRAISNYRKRRQKKKLQQATDRFERHHIGLSPKKGASTNSPKSNFNRAKSFSDDFDAASLAPTDYYDSSSEDEVTLTDRRSSIAHDAVSIPRIDNVPYAHGGFFGTAPFFLADRRWVQILRDLLPDVYVEISRRVGTTHYYSQLLKVGKNASLDYKQDASKLIHWAENNPVVAAYGVAMDLQLQQEIKLPKRTTKGLENSQTTKKESIIEEFYNQTETNNSQEHKSAPDENDETNDNSIGIQNLEWDIFVDPQKVRRVEAVLDAMNGYVASKISSSSTDKEFGNQVATKPASPSASSTTSSHSSKSESKADSCKNCVFCKTDATCQEIKPSNSFDEEGKTEAKALIADQDQNQSAMNLNSMGVNINNLCTTSAVDLCTECFPSTADFLNGVSSSNGVAGVESSSKHDLNDSITEEICLEHLKNDPVLKYLERELEKRTQELTDRLLIAHGNILQLIMEQSGVLKDWNYSRVQRQRRTLGGGMYARQWMAVFAESLRLGMKKPRKKRKPRNNFYDEDEDASSGLGETDALLSPHRERWYGLEKEDSFDDSDSFDYEDSDDDYEDFLERDLEDDNNACTCSPRCCLDFTMAESVKIIERITKTKQPIGILLDLKSRHVPKRVLSLMVRSLQAAGIRVVGIASFEMSDIRGVCTEPQDIFCESGNSTSCQFVSKIPFGIKAPLGGAKEILMAHSAGDLQAACDNGLVRPGDHVFFNGGSLILESARSSTLQSLVGFFFDMLACGFYSTFDPCAIENGYKIQSYGYACNSMDAMDAASCFADETRSLVERSCNGSPHRRKNASVHQNSIDMDDIVKDHSRPTTDEATEMEAVMKTLADYKKHYGFSVGLYLQEFSVDEAAAKILIDLVNDNPDLYDLGLAWGGINGMTVHGIQPRRFTSTDGYDMQRRLGKQWK